MDFFVCFSPFDNCSIDDRRYVHQLFNDNDVFTNYGIPMNPTDPTTIQGLEDQRQRAQNDASPNPATGSELISYQQGQTPIDFTDFLNLDDSNLNINTAGSLASTE